MKVIMGDPRILETILIRINGTRTRSIFIRKDVRQRDFSVKYLKILFFFIKLYISSKIKMKNCINKYVNK